MLPFLKDLAENQDLNIRLTAKQIEEADNASKAMGRMRAESNFVAQTLVTAAIPSMSVLTQELKRVFLGTDNAVEGIQRMRAEGTLTNWAEKTAYAIAVVIDALRGIGHTIKSVIGSFSAVWADIELAGTFLAGGKGLNPFSDENRSRLQAALEKRNAIVAQSNQNYVDLWEMPLLADAVTKRFDEIRKGTEASNAATQAATPRKQLNYSTATGAVTANAMAGIDSEVTRAAERGAERALACLGLENGHAARDIRDLRGLIDAWREARRTVWQTTVKVLTTGVLAALLVGIAIKLRLMGGPQ
jgi:hypothetical protein